jgi:hypothetical protein
MPARSPFLPRARKEYDSRAGFLLKSGAVAGMAVLALASCSPAVSIENADVPQWRSTALPTVPDAVIGDAGKILNRNRIIREAGNLTATCDGGGKAFFAVSLNGEEVVDAGAACNGSKETTRITLPRSGTLEISTSSVDAPLIYAYQLTPAD